MGTMNELINAATVGSLASQLRTAGAGELPHLAAAAVDVDGLSLRGRTDVVAAALLSDLPDDYRAVAALYRRALDSAAFGGWMMWPVSETVTTLALAASAQTDDGTVTDPGAFEDGLALLAELTPRLTSEFAIRRFLEADLERALAVVVTWTTDEDDRVRRLASEGTRPFLPWSIRVRSVLAHPEAAVPILDALHADDSDFVRRSVANHLNDLARENPGLVVSIATEWSRDAAAPGADPVAAANTRWVVRHGLRTLIKKANPGALALMGFAPATLEVTPLRLSPDLVTTPGELTLEFEVTNVGAEAVRLAVDYVVFYVKANGMLAPKVFKLATPTVAPGERVVLSKRHAFRPMTTRVHYAGTHAVELQINGQRYDRVGFELALG